ncbi:MAG: hypothetical protein H6907_14565 [Hyphomicrobiales bacterium]|nr:hypothetical protein [Hyphomicrobiales bacterium]
MRRSSDVYRTAHLMVTTYGEKARIGAGVMIDMMREKGDVDGRYLWLRVARAVDELLDCRPPAADASLH